MTKEFVLTLWNANYEAISLIHFCKFPLSSLEICLLAPRQNYSCNKCVSFQRFESITRKALFMGTVLKLSVVRCTLEKCNYPSEHLKKCTK